MKTEWDYTELAQAYLLRPAYASEAIAEIVRLAQIQPGQRVCDIGAGVGHMALQLCQHGLKILAIEPNDAMRALGMTRTSADVEWKEATAENTGEPDSTFRLVSFGSSFNVTDRPASLRESARILQPGGWFACAWNHRDLDNPIQSEIERIIRDNVADYTYGSRREDQTPCIDASGLFGPVHPIERGTLHRQSVAAVVEAWRSHATLQRQAGPQFAAVIAQIEQYLRSLNQETIDIPYTTRVWCAQVKK